jgi:hypothetical protein
MPDRIEAVPTPRVIDEGGPVLVQASEGNRWLLYAEDVGGWTLRQVGWLDGAGEASLRLPAGRFALSVATRDGRESLGVLLGD